MSLFQLIYLSTAHDSVTFDDISMILDTSKRRNEESQITGMLLYADGNFMQVLEGDAKSIQQTMERIRKDPRHHGIIVLDNNPVSQRSFGAWHMGFRALDERDATSHPGFAPFFQNGFDAAAIGARKGLALDLLVNFRDSNR